MLDDIGCAVGGHFPALDPTPGTTAYMAPEQPRRRGGRPKRGEGYETTEPIRPPPMPLPFPPEGRTESSDTVPIDKSELARGLAIVRATMPEPGPTLTEEELAALLDEEELPTSPACPDAMKSSRPPKGAP